MIGQTQAHCLFGAPVAKFHQKTSDYGTYMAQEAVHFFFRGVAILTASVPLSQWSFFWTTTDWLAALSLACLFDLAISLAAGVFGFGYY